MRPFSGTSGRIVPLDRADVDTDQIVPKQFLKLVQRTGFGRYLFYGWRHDAGGRPAPGFVLDDPAYAGARILVAGRNFGCGSSREHAAWAISDWGFEAVVAPSFADIFYGNCIKNGLLPARVSEDGARSLMGRREAAVDLASQTITSGDLVVDFEIGDVQKRILLEGLDDITRTLKLEDGISRHESGPSAPYVP
ncbi:MAG: 3-isopropylmalate dehydratase small subunit [Nitrosopumilus sp.]|nr:3-isopropylmalate dehydratase small subunit [Nitrosopumilus sp.]CAI9831978.1 3-isopropylmalate isomerase subunit [Nitrosopumilaceae archaeon]MDA7941753.1 3-isopropylmalate dehydratase small subunit [Nitrosopumilus sp.]MDA7943712.1 3-isopropylmalate dehydratase small subunit [Nitrosopumilus sp.]MDA7945681.1 3-isopropylmalate dehydratase small subunit [Nitrosopumilus sp.]